MCQYVDHWPIRSRAWRGGTSYHQVSWHFVSRQYIGCTALNDDSPSAAAKESSEIATLFTSPRKAPVTSEVHVTFGPLAGGIINREAEAGDLIDVKTKIQGEEDISPAKQCMGRHGLYVNDYINHGYLSVAPLLCEDPRMAVKFATVYDSDLESRQNSACEQLQSSSVPICRPLQTERVFETGDSKGKVMPNTPSRLSKATQHRVSVCDHEASCCNIQETLGLFYLGSTIFTKGRDVHTASRGQMGSESELTEVEYGSRLDHAGKSTPGAKSTTYEEICVNEEMPLKRKQIAVSDFARGTLLRPAVWLYLTLIMVSELKNHYTQFGTD